jgi:hypothetical protein
MRLVDCAVVDIDAPETCDYAVIVSPELTHAQLMAERMEVIPSGLQVSVTAGSLYTCIASARA